MCAVHLLAGDFPAVCMSDVLGYCRRLLACELIVECRNVQAIECSPRLVLDAALFSN